MLRILLVDDEPAVRRRVRRMIEGLEGADWWLAAEAEDGERALFLIRREQPDLVLTDIRMPGLDGLELIRRSLAELPRLKFIILSGYNEFDYAKEAMFFGVRHYLLKPIDSAELFKALDDLQSEMVQDGTVPEKVQLPEGDPRSRHHEVVARVCAYARTRFQDELTLKEVAGLVFMHPVYLGRLFHQEMGMTFHDYLRLVRVEAAVQLLEKGNLPVYEISEAVGYKAAGHFFRVFRSLKGMSPGEYRQRSGQGLGRKEQ